VSSPRSLSGSRNINVSRLYEGTRRAKPIVRTSGSSAESTQSSSTAVLPRASHARLTRLRAISTNSVRISRLACQRSDSGISSMRSHISSGLVIPICFFARAKIFGETHVGACTPFVIEVMGISELSKPGQRFENMSRETSPCSRLTPLARPASANPIMAILKNSPLGSKPSAIIESTGMWEIDPSPVKQFLISSAGKRSIPAETGVRVVKTVLARVASSACAKFRPS